MTDPTTSAETPQAPSEGTSGRSGRRSAAGRAEGGARRVAGREYEAFDVEDDDEADGPTDEEVEAWAERQRERRAAWAQGPTDAEKVMWARRERQRRQTRVPPSAAAWEADDWPPGFDPLVQRYQREAQLALEGTLAWASTWPWRAFACLVRSGRDWEEETFRPVGRRRVVLTDDDY